MKNIVLTPSITDRSSDSIKRYFSEISAVKLLSAQEERDLIHAAHQGSKAAFDKLVTANLRFVVSIAKMYQNRGLSLDDLIQEGNFGLMEAVDRFDEERDCRFLTYAVHQVCKHIQSALQQVGRTIRIPANRYQFLTDMWKAAKSFEQIHQRTPSHQELAEMLGVSSQEVADLLLIDSKVSSLDKPLADDKDAHTLADLLSSDSTLADHDVMQESRHQELMEALDTLTPRERTVLLMAFGIGQDFPSSVYEIADHLCLSHERVRQLQRTALQKLRHGSHRSLLLACIA